MEGAVKIKLSVWHLMGTYVGGLLLLILMSHYLPPFYHVPDTVTSVSRHAFQSSPYEKVAVSIPFIPVKKPKHRKLHSGLVSGEPGFKLSHSDPWGEGHG